MRASSTPQLPCPAHLCILRAGTVLTAGSGQTLLGLVHTDRHRRLHRLHHTATITVKTATPTITWANPAAIFYGTALSSAQLDATASVAGTFIYTPPLGTVLDAGNGQRLSVTFTPTDTTDYNTATATATLNVNKATTSIAWVDPDDITYGTALAQPSSTPLPRYPARSRTTRQSGRSSMRGMGRRCR